MPETRQRDLGRAQSPTGRGARSVSCTLRPARAKTTAAARPLGPDPTTFTSIMYVHTTRKNGDRDVPPALVIDGARHASIEKICAELSQTLLVNLSISGAGLKGCGPRKHRRSRGATTALYPHLR